MDINDSIKSRTDLKSYFVKNAIPTQSNFAELIESGLNQREDGLVKTAGAPLSIESSGGDGSQMKAINFYANFAEEKPHWVLSLNPRSDPTKPETARPGFSISDADGNSRLFADHATGKIGIGKIDPEDDLDVGGYLRVLSDTNPLRFTSTWSNFASTNQAEISNDTGTYKTLMIVGNKSNGGVRRVSVWDRLEINGDLVVNETGQLEFSAKFGQRIDFWNGNSGIGTQDWTQYYRTTRNFAWYAGGTHAGGELDPGGGTLQMAIKSGNVGIGTASPSSKLDVNGYTETLGISVNNGQNTGVGRGLCVWNPNDTNHVIYSASPTGKSPANVTAVKGYFDAGHRMRFRTYYNGQGFLFENSKEQALVDIDSNNGNIWTKGEIYCKGIVVVENRTTHLETDGALYRYGGQVYLTVDDNLFIRDTRGSIKFHFNTNSGIIHQQSWQTPAFLNGWQNYSTTYNAAGYFKDRQGIVHLRGLVKNGGIGKTIFTLPAGYRPARRELQVICTNSNASGRVDIYSSGVVVATAGNSGWFSLDGVTFRAV